MGCSEAFRLGEAIHTASQSTTDAGQGAGTGDDDVMDAEFTEVDDDQKKKTK
jgi:hypothetical protein